MARIINPVADAMLDVKIPVLDHGFVVPIDYMGGDKRVVQSARVCYADETKTIREDEGLINYLLSNAHTSPFEMVETTFMVKAPIFVIRQWFRHRTASINEESGRYSVLKDEFHLPPLDGLRRQSDLNKQATIDSDVLTGPAAFDVREGLRFTCQDAHNRYKHDLDAGLCREQARIQLTLATYSTFYWKMDLHNMFHFLKLRLDWHAQKEIRVYGEAMAEFVKAVAPMCYAAFKEHVLNAQKFSATELRHLRLLMNSSADPTGLRGVDSAGHRTQLDILDTFMSVEGCSPKEINALKKKLV